MMMILMSMYSAFTIVIELSYFLNYRIFFLRKFFLKLNLRNFCFLQNEFHHRLFFDTARSLLNSMSYVCTLQSIRKVFLFNFSSHIFSTFFGRWCGCVITLCRVCLVFICVWQFGTHAFVYWKLK